MNDDDFRQALDDLLGTSVPDRTLQGEMTLNAKAIYCPVRGKELESAKTMKELRWIPCSERLPEKHGVYLVTTSIGQVQVHVFSPHGNSKEYWMRCNKAWMPLPEPYVEEVNHDND